MYDIHGVNAVQVQLRTTVHNHAVTIRFAIAPTRALLNLSRITLIF